jgi:hypothetical protein
MTLLLPHAPAPVSSCCEDPRLRRQPDPVRPPPTHQSTPPGLTLSPLITIPWGLLGLGLGLAFQQIRPELGFEAGPARLGLGLLPGLVLGLLAHAARTLSQQSLYHAYIYPSRAGGLRLACASLLWQGRARKRGILGERTCRLQTFAAFRTSAGSLSRRSSVVEHVIGNDGVGSSILPDGTSKISNLAHISSAVPGGGLRQG